MDYRRIVSYIYAYHAGEKGKNVGFAKIETRNMQSKFMISLKGIYTETPENYGIYLFVRDGNSINGIKVGNIMVNNGIGNFQEMFYPQNIADSGYSIEKINGIFIGNPNNKENILASQWEETDLNVRDIIFPGEARKVESASAEVNSNTIADAGSTNINSEIQSDTQPLVNVTAQYSNITNVANVADISDAADVANAAAPTPVSFGSPTPELINLQSDQVATSNTNTTYVASDNSAHDDTSSDNIASDHIVSDHTAYDDAVNDDDVNDVSKNPINNTEAENILESAAVITDPIQNLYKMCDQIDAFDDDDYYNCIEVSPDNLKELPLGEVNIQNNSFMMHGFYNFKHLLFGKVQRDNEENLYFIGVPGVYSNRERFMASMYGFNNFKRSHRSDYRNPYFGYWYMEIYI